MSILKKARKGDTIRITDPLTGSCREYLIGYMECALAGPLDDGSDIRAYCINPAYDERYPNEYVLSESTLSERAKGGFVVDLLAEEVTR